MKLSKEKEPGRSIYEIALFVSYTCLLVAACAAIYGLAIRLLIGSHWIMALFVIIPIAFLFIDKRIKNGPINHVGEKWQNPFR